MVGFACSEAFRCYKAANCNLRQNKRGGGVTGLYLHIPFCIKKCHYCNFVITTSGSEGKQTEFLSCLEKEMDHYGDHFRNVLFETLYLGGGTPSSLSEETLEELLSLVGSHFKFKKDAERTCEVNPGDLNEKKIRVLKEFDVRRISLGVQTFKEETLKRLNRAHGAEDTLRSYDLLRKSGFKNINMDFILSLPGETIEDVKDSLGKAVKLGVEHVSLYELTIEEHTVFDDWHRKEKLGLPDEDTQMKLLSFARDFLKQNNFEHYELLNYAKAGYRSHHNVLYWANQDYLGLGPGAFSYFDGRRFRSSASVDEYLEKMRRGDWTPQEEECLSPEKKEIESLLLALRLSEGAPVKKFRPILRKLKNSVDQLERQGLLVQDPQSLRLSPRGQFFAETVFSELSC